MRTPRLVLTTGLAALSLAALAACATPTSGGTGDGSDPDGSAGGTGGTGTGLAGCLPGTWAADVDDLAAQLQQYFTDNGTPVVSTVADGGTTLVVDATTMTYDAAMSITAVADADGLEMVILQEHVGVSTGDWSADGDDVVFANWNNDLAITTTITIEGTSAGTPTVTPGEGGEGVAMAVTCDGDTMTTAPDASPFVTRWIRVG